MRLDFGALYNKFLGETERNLRDALKVADAMAPSVLWMDEIEKGIATNDNDGGESRRILGTLLTWMAERKSKVFVVATSNDIEALPPELVRKGRLDEIFFVDLPSETARGEILRIHLGRRKQDPAGFDLPSLVAACDGFSGAEIEQVVVGALYEARAASAPLATSHLLDEAKRTKPLSVVMAEKIAWLRAWAQGRTVRAD
jgi:SpoVK/Ycf46/Vps4 family AAA+-type ATPase